MRHEIPERPELGHRDGLAYALFLPREEPTGGVVVVHGAGSAKENHFDFARALRAHGLAALCFDQRGHGRSGGEWGPTALGDVLAMCDVLEPLAPHLALRGSSMGGFCAIHAAALDDRIAAVVAICPAPEDFLLRSLRSGSLRGFRADVEAAERWLGSLDLKAAAANLSPRTSLLLMHAEGDEQIPYAVSEELHAAASEPKRLLVLPGGHHRSLQHDTEMQAVSVRFVADTTGRRRDVG
jgi:alpha-beta hydrolase superfamily lysophospholipase